MASFGLALGNAGQHLTNFDQSRLGQTLGQRWPHLGPSAMLCRSWSDVGHLWQTQNRTSPNLVELGKISNPGTNLEQLQNNLKASRELSKFAESSPRGTILDAQRATARPLPGSFALSPTIGMSTAADITTLTPCAIDRSIHQIARRCSASPQDLPFKHSKVSPSRRDKLSSSLAVAHLQVRHLRNFVQAQL